MSSDPEWLQTSKPDREITSVCMLAMKIVVRKTWVKYQHNGNTVQLQETYWLFLPKFASKWVTVRAAQPISCCRRVATVVANKRCERNDNLIDELFPLLGPVMEVRDPVAFSASFLPECNARCWALSQPLCVNFLCLGSLHISEWAIGESRVLNQTGKVRHSQRPQWVEIHDVRFHVGLIIYTECICLLAFFSVGDQNNM